MKRFGVWNYVAISVYAFALSYLWNSMGPIILPALVPPLAPEALKGTALGLLSAVGLIVAVIVQPVAGAVSDRSTARWGRRRPYILVGALLNLVFLAIIAASGNYWLLFAGYIGLQFVSNVAHGPYQGLIPDLVPEQRLGTASGAKNLAEILGIVVCSQFIARLLQPYVSGQGQIWLWLTFGSIMGIIFVTMLITILAVKEQPLTKSPDDRPLLATILGTFNVDVRRYPDFMWLLVSRFFILVGVNLVRNFAEYFIKDVIEPVNYVTVAGNLLAILGVAILFVVFPAGYISDRLGRKRLVVFSGLLAAVGSFLLIFTRGYNDLFIYGGIIGLAMGIFLSTNWALAIDLIPRDEGGRYLCISNLATAGSGVAAGLGGPLLDFFNARQANLGYTALFITATLCCLLGTVLLVKVREARTRNLAKVSEPSPG